MVIIKCNALLSPPGIDALRDDLKKQADTGRLVLPSFCELLTQTPGDEETLALVMEADGQPVYCTGCNYMKEYAGRAQGQKGPSTLICPYHYTQGGPWVFCPVWPYAEKQEVPPGVL